MSATAALLHRREPVFDLVLRQELERRDGTAAQPFEMGGDAGCDLELDLVERDDLEPGPRERRRGFVERRERRPLDLERTREVPPPRDVAEAIAELGSNAGGTSRPQHPCQLGSRRVPIAEVVEHEEQECEIAAPVGEWDLLGAALEIRDVRVCGGRGGDRAHPRRGLDAVDGTAEAVGQAGREAAGSRAEIEDGQRSARVRVTLDRVHPGIHRTWRKRPSFAVTPPEAVVEVDGHLFRR